MGKKERMIFSGFLLTAAELVCHGLDPPRTLVGKGAMAGLCEERPTFYEICSGLRTTKHTSGGNDKCLLTTEWDTSIQEMHYTPTGPLERHHGGHSYERLYALYFTALRNRPISLLEIGVKEGDSLRLWCKYFRAPSHFALLGVKLRRKALRQATKENCALHSVSMHKADQGSSAQLITAATDAMSRIRELRGKAWRASPEGFDVIVDDGSHTCPHITRSFNVLFPLLVPGGVYIIEDLNAEYSTSCHQFLTGLNEFVHMRLLAADWPNRIWWPRVANGTISSVNCAFEMCVVVRSL